jgi:uncharacterized membrane protein
LCPGSRKKGRQEKGNDMTDFLITAAVAFGIFIVIDFIWLILIAKKLYDRELKDIKKKRINWAAAVIFYIIYIAGVAFFVIMPAMEKGSIAFAVYAGAFFGLVAYATYDLTNLATMKGFPLKITIIDLIWGSFVTTAVSVLTYLILS